MMVDGLGRLLALIDSPERWKRGCVLQIIIIIIITKGQVVQIFIWNNLGGGGAVLVHNIFVKTPTLLCNISDHSRKVQAMLVMIDGRAATLSDSWE